MPFRNLEQQALRPGKTVELTLNQLSGDPVLVVEHLGETNADFWNDALAKANARSFQAGSAGKKLDANAVKSARAKNRSYVAKYAVRELKNLYHDGPDGRPDKSRPATVDDIADVVNALPDEVFDTVFSFVSNPENFRDREAIADDP